MTLDFQGANEISKETDPSSPDTVCKRNSDKVVDSQKYFFLIPDCAQLARQFMWFLDSMPNRGQKVESIV